MPTCSCHLTLDLSSKYSYQLIGVSIHKHIQSCTFNSAQQEALHENKSILLLCVYHRGRILHMHILKAYGGLAM